MDSNPFIAVGLLQGVHARSPRHDDWERDLRSLEDASDRNRRMRAIWTALDRIAQVLLHPVSALRVAHV